MKCAPGDVPIRGPGACHTAQSCKCLLLMDSEVPGFLGRPASCTPGRVAGVTGVAGETKTGAYHSSPTAGQDTELISFKILDFDDTEANTPALSAHDWPPRPWSCAVFTRCCPHAQGQSPWPGS